ncbi:MAG: class IV adenylate cyclase [Terriglobia bacterium]
MTSRREVEVKLKVSDPRALRRRLKQLGFERLTPRLRERNSLFDFPDSRLGRDRCAVRLRLAGRTALLTYKGPRVQSARYKVREEIETGVADARRLRKILRRLGLREVLRYDKHRTTYAPPASSSRRLGVLTYDETPVGNYIELEGAPRWIDATAEALGYHHKDYITASYISLNNAKSVSALRKRKRKPSAKRPR